MKRRSFFRKLSVASIAFVAAPGVFRCLPAQKNLRETIAALPRIKNLTSQSLDLYEWLEINYEIVRARNKRAAEQKILIDSFFDDLPVNPDRWKNLHLTAPTGNYTGPNVKHLLRLSEKTG